MTPLVLYGATGSGAVAPRMARVVRTMDEEPRLADLWQRRFPCVFP